MYRIGFGKDIHQLAEGRNLVLGGIFIEHTKGPVAHSDGDVLIHAICDAMLGAANLRDIGFHFPDTSKDFEGIDSKILLEKTNFIINQKGYCIVNIDSTLCLQRPKVMNYVPQMQEVMAERLKISPDDISIKATTNEKLGYVGKEEGIEAYAVVLLRKIKE
jgi:2-C-methyl-D-erythritol 2,4-cyclodiphosphate synthase